MSMQRALSPKILLISLTAICLLAVVSGFFASPHEEMKGQLRAAAPFSRLQASVRHDTAEATVRRVFHLREI